MDIDLNNQESEVSNSAVLAENSQGRKRQRAGTERGTGVRTRRTRTVNTSSAGAPTPSFDDSEQDGVALEAPIEAPAQARKQDVPSTALAWRDEQILVLRMENRELFLKHGNTTVEEKWDRIGKLMEAELQRQRSEASDVESDTARSGLGVGIPERVPVPEAFDPQWFSGKRLHDRVRRLDLKTKDVSPAASSGPASSTSHPSTLSLWVALGHCLHHLR